MDRDFYELLRFRSFCFRIASVGDFYLAQVNEEITRLQ